LEDLLETFGKNTQVRLQERSIYSSYHVFTEIAKNNLFLNEKERKILDKQFSIFTSGQMREITTPDLIIYVRASPRTCYERMKKRDREEERNVHFSQLEAVHDAYEAWLNGPQYRIPCPVAIFNGEVEEDDLAPELLEIEEEIEMRRRIKQNRTEELKKYRQDMDMGVLRLSRPSSPKDWDQD
jgi:deoxyadenosine/deoxycytidine kinase